MKSKKNQIPTVDTLMRVDGTSTPVTPKNGVSYGLEELYKMLGCSMVQVVYTVADKNLILICDEEGLFVPNPTVNSAASILAGQPIVGNVLACHTKRFK